MQILNMLFPMAMASIAVSAALEMTGSPISASASTITLASGPTNCATSPEGASSLARGLLGFATISKGAFSNNSENTTVFCTSCPPPVNNPLVELGPTLLLSSIPDSSSHTGMDSFPTGVDSFPTGVDSFPAGINTFPTVVNSSPKGVHSVPTALDLISAEPIETVSLTTTSTVIVGRNNSHTSSSFPCRTTMNSAVIGDIFSPFVDFPVTATLPVSVYYSTSTLNYYSSVCANVTVNKTITISPVEASVSKTQTTSAPSTTGGATNKYSNIIVIVGMVAFTLLVV